MTRFFYFDKITWREVKDLPRDTPLILPLGSGYSQRQLEERLGSSPQIGWLPEFPFGWLNSILAVNPSLLENYLKNLILGLSEDGFSSTYIVTPPDVNLGNLAQSIQLHPVVDNSIRFPMDTQDVDKVVIIPIGHTEQHAYHLPLSTDTIIIDAIAQGIVNSIPQYATRLPVMPYGVSTHRSAFAGTFNAGGRAFEDFWLDVIGKLMRLGFRQLYFVSGHGGNCSFLTNIVKYAGEKYPDVFSATAWLYLSGSSGVSALDQQRTSKLGGMGHAGELETSLMLHLQPKLVNMDQVFDDIDYICTPSYYMDWVEAGALVANPPWYDDTISGAYGAGSYATKEKGQYWLQAAIDEKISHVFEILEQKARRELRRKNGFGMWGELSSR